MYRSWLIFALIASAVVMVSSIYFSSTVGKECASISLSEVGNSLTGGVCLNLSTGDSVELTCDANVSVRLVGVNVGIEQGIYLGQKLVVASSGNYCILGVNETIVNGCVLVVCRSTWITLLFRLVAIVSGLALVSFMALLFIDLTKSEKYGIQQEIVISDKLRCESRSLTKHRCRYSISDHESKGQVLGKLVRFFVDKLGYKVVIREEGFAVLRGKLGKGVRSKGVELLMYFPSDDTLLLDFTVSGLSASGLLDLEKIVDQIKDVCKLDHDGNNS